MEMEVSINAKFQLNIYKVKHKSTQTFGVNITIVYFSFEISHKFLNIEINILYFKGNFNLIIQL